MNEEVEMLRGLRAILQDSSHSMTSAQLEEAAKKAHDLAEKLRDTGNPTMAADAEKLATQLAAAAQTTLDADAKHFATEAEDRLVALVKTGKALVDDLRKDGLEENAAELDRIVKVCSDVLDGQAQSDEL